MINKVTYEVLDTLAEKFIPEGTHKLLYVNSREMWKEVMTALIESDLIEKKLSIITKCAINWEAVLVHKLSIQN
jgi:hypothetical protein